MRRTWIALDLAIVVIFVAIGRSNHHHAESFAGLCSTAWPFVVGLLVAWAFLGWRRRDGTRARDGVAICVLTVALGMVLRVVAGQGTAFAFVLVALAFLGGLMVGLRVLSHRFRRRGVRASTSAR